MRETSFLWDYFLGPRGENVQLLSELLTAGLNHYQRWREGLYPEDESIFPENYPKGVYFKKDLERLSAAWEEFLQKMDQNIPYPSVRYGAQMLKDPALPAVLAYFYTLLTNPNNHAYEGGPVTTQMEMEVVQQLLSLVGFETGWGHLTSGGSLANMEALWAVRDFRKSGTVVFSKGSHYSWKRIASILKTGKVAEIPVDAHYRMDLNALESELKNGNVMIIIANLGTTGTGAVDPLEAILKLRDRYGFHLHVDAAYGGYYRSVILDQDGCLMPFDAAEIPVSDYVYSQLALLGEADSITLDPHKHGLVGYGAGSVLFKDEALRQVILNTAPYTYHVTDKPNIGMFTLEGSRPGAAAAAVWFTHKLIPLNESGYGQILMRCRETAQALYDELSQFESLRAICEPDLDLIGFYRIGRNPKSLQSINEATEAIYRKLSVENPGAPFILSKFVIDPETAGRILPGVEIDTDHFTAMRGVFMKHWMRMGRKPDYLDRLIEELRKFDG
ncbi:L-2,4-diaminobutyrate decarboxylase [bacterium BMS3Abin05]|nr:L-2,4-diaminobutyrate decarboxylase [bacterium BMS3Abin05]GBE28058.1 L-2,4-diaminobutyrate decarboxylase [bacterium BMS3Bbin03]